MKKILLIEDDPLLIDIYSTKLKQSGFEVSVVEQGEKALLAIESERPDLVLLDIVLPHTDGWDILSQVQASEELRTIPVVVLSNLGQKEEIEKGLNLGAVKYLIKAHYTPSEIVEEVIKLVQTI
ncbi:MAG: response regulator [Patescibacteria group bacterium]